MAAFSSLASSSDMGVEYGVVVVMASPFERAESLWAFASTTGSVASCMVAKLLVTTDSVGCERVVCAWDKDGVDGEAGCMADDDVSELRGTSDVIIFYLLSVSLFFLRERE